MLLPEVHVDTLPALAAVVVLLTLYVVYIYVTNPLKAFPGPWHTRITGLSWDIRCMTGTRSHWVERLHKQYGEVVRVRPQQLSVTDEDSINKLVAFNTGFVKDPHHYGALSTRPKVGTVFTMWKKADHAKRRRLLAHGFSKANILRLEPFVVEKAKLLASQYFKRAGQVVDVLIWHRFLASDVINKVGFDVDLGSVNSGKQHHFVSDLDNLNYLFIIDGIAHPLYLAMRYLTSRFLHPDNRVRQFWTASERAYDLFTDPIASKYFANFVQGSDRPELIGKFLQSMDAPGSDLNLTKITTELTDLNIAGTDTTSTTMTYLLWRLTQNPQWMRRLKEEINNAMPVPSNLPSYAELEQLPVFTACLKETLRIDCALPGPQPRAISSGGIVIAGKPVPENSIVSVQPYSTARNTVIWGKDAAEWNPERWFNIQKEQSGAGFRTFGGGATVCLGIHLAYVELYVAMALIIRLFDFKTEPGFTPDQMEQFDFNLGHPRDWKCPLIFTPLKETAAAIAAFEATDFH